MREYANKKNETTYFVGTTMEIKSLYRSISKHSNAIMPAFCDFPKFNTEKMCYALAIKPEVFYGEHTGFYNMYIVNSDTMLSILLDGDAVEGKGTR